MIPFLGGQQHELMKSSCYGTIMVIAYHMLLTISEYKANRNGHVNDSDDWTWLPSCRIMLLYRSRWILFPRLGGPSPMYRPLVFNCVAHIEFCASSWFSQLSYIWSVVDSILPLNTGPYSTCMLVSKVTSVRKLLRDRFLAGYRISPSYVESAVR